MGDFNIDLHSTTNSSNISKYENVTISSGFIPLISLYSFTHTKNQIVTPLVLTTYLLITMTMSYFQELF